VFVVGIDAHTRYVVLVVLNSSGQRVLGPTRVRVSEPARVREVLAPFQPLEAVVETSSTWPWLEDVLQPLGVRFVLAHARRLRAIAEANYKRDEIDAELLGRMRLAGLIPAVYATPPTQREWATLIRHRTALVAQRTAPVNRIHAQLHRRGLWLERGRLLTRQGRAWVRHEAGPQLSLEERALVRSYAGLAPRSSQSGERGIRHGSIPAGANRWLRGALVRAVVSHVQTAPASALSQYYTMQKARVGWPVARVATARKLARVIHALLRTQRTWIETPTRGELRSTHAAQTAII